MTTNDKKTDHINLLKDTVKPLLVDISSGVPVKAKGLKTNKQTHPEEQRTDTQINAVDERNLEKTTLVTFRTHPYKE